MIRISLALVMALSVLPGISNAQTASEIPLENPEILKPDSRPQGNDETFSKRDIKPVEAIEKSMTVERISKIVRALDDTAIIAGNQMQMSVNDVKLLLIVDPVNNRMRAFTPIRSLDGVKQSELYRLMQANFDSALDARYAIAKEHIISVFIHPLAELRKNQLIEGIGQVVNLVLTYGTAYTSGAMTFGGGDSRELHRKLIDDLLKKGEEI